MQKLTAADSETRSADLIADNLDRRKALFPEAFTEGKIDYDVLSQVLGGGVDEREEKYGLNWHGKRRGEPLSHGIIAGYRELSPLRESNIVVRDSAFADDVAKINMAAVLEQHGLAHVRSL